MSGQYEEWQTTLVAAFLTPREGPVVFFVDETELRRLCPDTPNVVDNLSAAVRSELQPDAGQSMFGRVMASYQRWRRGPRLDAPPVLPVIAITVLAATMMRSDANARSTNYYLRLAELLARDDTAESIETVRNDLRQGDAFLDVVDMWRGLHKWIESQDGAVGTSTIHDHTHFQRIGYPLSQAIVRQSDRTALTRFFHAINLDPDAAPDDRVLFKSLIVWTEGGQSGLSESFIRALSDAELRTLVISVARAHAQAWDGRVLTSDGSRRIAMRLGVDLHTWQARWLFPVPPDEPESISVLDSQSKQEVTLTARPGSDYYAADGSPAVTPERLLSGFRLRGNEFTAEFPASPVLFLRRDPQTGALTSAIGILPFEEHLVAVSAAHVADFQEVLSHAAVEGWSSVPQRRSALLSGYALYKDVRFKDDHALKRALGRFPGLRRVGVAPPVVPRARLVRGLPLATSISSRHYLVGGEPDLLIPPQVDRRRVTVMIDGRREQLEANGFPLELRRFIGEAGSHVVNADGDELSFTTLQEGPQIVPPSRVPSLGWMSDVEISDQGPTFVVTGACVSYRAKSTSLVMARRGRDESWLLLDHGRAERVTEPSPPAFLDTFDVELHLPQFEVNAPSTARWLAQRRGDRWHLTAIAPAATRKYELDFNVLEAWKRACKDTNGAQLWKAQLSMAARTM